MSLLVAVDAAVAAVAGPLLCLYIALHIPFQYIPDIFLSSYFSLIISINTHTYIDFAYSLSFIRVQLAMEHFIPSDHRLRNIQRREDMGSERKVSIVYVCIWAVETGMRHIAYSFPGTYLTTILDLVKSKKINPATELGTICCHPTDFTEAIVTTNSMILYRT